MGAGVILGQVVGVVRCDQRDAGFLAQAVELGQKLLVELEPMVLDFEVEVLFAEDVEVFVSQPATLLVVVLLD